MTATTRCNIEYKGKEGMKKDRTPASKVGESLGNLFKTQH